MLGLLFLVGVARAGEPGLTPARQAALDAYALATPVAECASAERLGAYLARPAEGEVEKAWLVYRWITANITYDAASFFAGRPVDARPQAVLSSRCSVCAGFATLYEAVARAAGLQCEAISGWAKGLGYGVGDSLDGYPNHAWIAVRVDGQWRLSDPTWGAGYLEGTGFVRRFEPFYFLTPAEEMITSHLPQEDRWQLLAQPVDKVAFRRFVLTRPTFYSCGLRLASHKQAEIQTDDDLTVKLLGPPSTTLVANLVAGEQPLDDHLTLVQREPDGFAVHAAFPAPGNYTLRIFARPRDAQGPFQWALDYRVTATGGTPECGFPQTFLAMTEHHACLNAPLNRCLRGGETVCFDVQAPGAADVQVISGGDWTPLRRLPGDRFAAPVTVARGRVQIAARWGAGTNYEILAEYDAS